MGKRKLRFDQRKNYERKKYGVTELSVSIPLSQLPQAVIPLEMAHPSQLMIHLPLSAYTSSTVPDTTALYLRLRRSNLLPPGWTATCLSDESASQPTSSLLPSLALCKLQCLPPLFRADVTFTLTMSTQCTWTLTLGSRDIDPQRCQLMAGIAQRLRSVDEVVNLLSALDASKFCVGNHDAKFEQLVDRHKGSFKDQSGKLLNISQ